MTGDEPGPGFRPQAFDPPLTATWSPLKEGWPHLARLLAAAVDGLRAARGAVASPDARTTVVAHSYGTWVVDEAADEPGSLAADAVVLLGSPGMDGAAADLETPSVFDAATPADPISWATWFGSRHTWEEGYGATGLPIETSTGHSEYFDPDHPTLAAMGEVVAGIRRPE